IRGHSMAEYAVHALRPAIRQTLSESESARPPGGNEPSPPVNHLRGGFETAPPRRGILDDTTTRSHPVPPQRPRRSIRPRPRRAREPLAPGPLRRDRDVPGPAGRRPGVRGGRILREGHPARPGREVPGLPWAEEAILGPEAGQPRDSNARRRLGPG